MHAWRQQLIDMHEAAHSSLQRTDANGGTGVRRNPTEKVQAGDQLGRDRRRSLHSSILLMTSKKIACAQLFKDESLLISCSTEEHPMADQGNVRKRQSRGCGETRCSEGFARAGWNR